MKVFFWTIGGLFVLMSAAVFLPHLIQQGPTARVDSERIYDAIDVERNLHGLPVLVREQILTDAAQRAIGIVYSQNVNRNPVQRFNIVFDARAGESFSNVGSAYAFNNVDGFELVNIWRQDPNTEALFSDTTNAVGIGTALSKDGVPFVLVIFAHENK